MGRHSLIWAQVQVVCIALCLVPPGRLAHADDSSRLASAEQHLEAVEFDAARDAAHAAVQSGALGAKDLARAYEIIGVCAAAVGNKEEARAAYLRLLALKPGARPSDILAPEKNRVFYEAQGFWQARLERFELRVIVVPPWRVEVSVQDPLTMAQTLRYGAVANPQDRQARELTPAEPLSLAFPAEGPRDLAFELLDPHGNVLARREVTLGGAEPSAVATPGPPLAPGPVIDAKPVAPPPASPPKDAARSRWRSPWLWGAVSVVVVGAAATTTWLLVRERDVPVHTDVSIGH